MRIWARYHPTAAQLAPSEPALLLEGSWPTASNPSARYSLDRFIDARCAWIDSTAADLAETTIDSLADHARHSEFAWLNIVKLRYALVKLLRVVAFFRELWPLGPGQSVELYLDQPSDEVYAALVGELCAADGAKLRIHWLATTTGANSAPRGDAWWRRSLAKVNGWIDQIPKIEVGEPRVALCGNPRILDPVAAELARRGHCGWWLYERFAVGSWFRWTGRGFGQIVINRPSTLTEAEPTVTVGETSIDDLLSSAIDAWLNEQVLSLGEQHAQLLTTLREEFHRRRPTHIVLDQDATPLNRAVALAAREIGARTLVVQHGVPYIRFGFAPLEADAICAWGESSRDQLESWGINRQRIHLTGFPPHDQLAPRLARVRAQPSNGLAEQYLFLATPVPRDDRPDAVTYHQTNETYAAMVRMAFATVRDAGIGRLIVKLHPRDPQAAIVRSLVRECTGLKTQIIERGDLAPLLVGTSCVLSCASSAGVEATLGGVPVIQLMPAGSLDLISGAHWGLLGTARTREELELLLDEARRRWAQGRVSPSQRVFASLDSSASASVVDVLFSLKSAAEVDEDGPQLANLEAAR